MSYKNDSQGKEHIPDSREDRRRKNEIKIDVKMSQKSKIMARSVIGNRSGGMEDLANV